MKRFIIALLIGIILSLSQVLASNWVEIDSKLYVDVDSISIQTDINNDTIVSFWLKRLNNQDSIMKRWEKKYNQKIWYDKTYQSLNINNMTIKYNEWLIYNLKQEVIDSMNFDSMSIWHRIVPDTKAEAIYEFFVNYLNAYSH